MKVPLLLKEIESKTEDPVEKEAINKILQSKESSLRDLDDKMKWLKNFDRLLEIQRSIVWPSVLELDPKQYFPEFLKVKVNVDTNLSAILFENLSMNLSKNQSLIQYHSAFQGCAVEAAVRAADRVAAAPDPDGGAADAARLRQTVRDVPRPL